MELQPLRFGLAEGTAKGLLIIDGAADMPRARTDLQLQELNLKSFFAGSQFARATEGAFSGHIQLAGSGISLARILGVSDGRVVVTMAGGKISQRLVEAADTDVMEMMPLFFGKDKTTNIRCAAGDFPVQGGLLKSRILFLDTDKTNIAGDAQVNLKNETIDASLDARPKDITLLSLQSRIRLTGKFSNPDLMINPVNIGIRGTIAVLLGAVAPPAAILPFIEPASGKDSDCKARSAMPRWKNKDNETAPHRQALYRLVERIQNPMTGLIDIVCGIDSNYAPHLAVMLRSLVRYNPKQRFRVHVLNDAVPDDLRRRVEACNKEIEINWIDA